MNRMMHRERADGTVFVSLSLLKRFTRDVFVKLGVPPRDADVCADVLGAADQYGIDSHGVNRLKPIYYDRIKAGILDPVTRLEIVRETRTTAVVDGHNGMGHVVARRCMNMAIAKAKKYDMGMVVARNSTHYGIAGYYALMAVKAGMIGVSGTNARPSVAPTFGTENMLGTNPLTFGLPTDEPFPFWIDCATSVTQRGKIELYERLGRKIPRGLAINADGLSQTDPGRVLADLSAGRAALTPLGGIGEETGGHKGYGYATLVEILCAALQSGKYMKALAGSKEGKPAPIELGHFFIAVNIGAFTKPAGFRKTAGAILRELRASRKAPGCSRIFTAGEKEHLAFQERKRRGAPVPPAVQKEMLAMRDELGLTRYRFPFPEPRIRNLSA